MIAKKKSAALKISLALLAVAAVAILLLAIPSFRSSPAPANTPTLAPLLTPTPADRWFELLERTPYPYTTPLPPPAPTIVDGTYAKFNPDEIIPIRCRRCPDYAPEGGVWKLHLDRGIFRIYYEVTGWRSIASFALAGDRLYLFNDPNCHLETGVYKWKLEEGQLTLEVIEDPCAIRLRGRNLAAQPWLSCQPPTMEAAVTDHWLKPESCER